ncbi:MAG TPA: hypothetical protein VG033_06810 [Candidatus Acidoferrales bacterium]|jgi:hypothetical protein|nr:hypothetical protein [Candidatus Acidoferrales bacterium]
MQCEGTIDIHQVFGGGGVVFNVFFSPYLSRAEKGTQSCRRFQEPGQIGKFLKALGVQSDLIIEALGKLTAGRSTSIPNVVLSVAAIRSHGLESTAIPKRRIS